MAVLFPGSLSTHRALMTDIAARTQMQVVHMDYPLAPEHPYPEAIDAIFDVYQALLVQGIQPKDIIISGILVVPISRWHCAYD